MFDDKLIISRDNINRLLELEFPLIKKIELDTYNILKRGNNGEPSK